MRKLFGFYDDFGYKVAAAATVALIAQPRRAEAQGSFLTDSANKLKEDVLNIGSLAVAGAMLVGLFFLASGLMKLKKAAESDGRESYSGGLWRIVVGTGLVAIPAFTGGLTELFLGSTQAGDVVKGDNIRF